MPREIVSSYELLEPLSSLDRLDFRRATVADVLDWSLSDIEDEKAIKAISFRRQMDLVKKLANLSPAQAGNLSLPDVLAAFAEHCLPLLVGSLSDPSGS